MTVRCSVFVGASLDGFIARKDGALDWLPAVESGQDYGYNEHMASIDTVVMGRKTFQKVLSMGEWPFAGKRVVLLSFGKPKVPGHLKGVEILTGSPGAIVQHLEKTGSRHLSLEGGKTTQWFLDASLVDELTITWVPILIGEGTPLFGPLKKDLPLQLVNSKRFPDGLLQSVYRRPLEPDR